MAGIRIQNLKEPIDATEYLFRRLHQVGIRSVHGVPGDYNLTALDYIEPCGLNWVGNANELNAAYAADGYARIKNVSAIVTTFGVGELSAINGIAGAFSEMIPVIHIVGCPSTDSQRHGMVLHHTLGNGDFNVFANMASHIAVNVAKLTDPSHIPDLVDTAVRECVIKSRPVYIMLPTDMVDAKVEGAKLQTPIDLEDPANDPDKEDYVVSVVMKYLTGAKRPVMLVDACAIRHRVLAEVNDLATKTNMPVFVTPMGKGAYDETRPNYGGVYSGASSLPHVKEAVEASDLILSIGALKSDFNTSGFSYRTSQLNSIDFHSDHCEVRYSSYPGVRMKGVLRKVIDQVDPSILSVQSISKAAYHGLPPAESSSIITHAWFWPRLGEFLQEGDVMVTETGTSSFGIWDTKYPKGVTALTQVLWGSIGWSVGSCQGAALAVKDSGENRRTVHVVGDGSLQLTAQELSTIIRQDLKPIIFVICNEGYTIERLIHGMDAKYNDIQAWDHRGLVDAFGAGNKSRKFAVKTRDELDKLLNDTSFKAAEQLQLVELYMPKKDHPRALNMSAMSSTPR